MIKINNRYLIKTQSGYKDFLGIRRSENTGIIIKTNISEIKCTNEHRILVGKSKAGKIYRKAHKLKIYDRIKNETIIDIQIDDNLKYYYDPLNVEDGNSYLSEDITHHNCAVIDECVEYNEKITVRNDETGEIFDISVGDFYKYLKDNKKE